MTEMTDAERTAHLREHLRGDFAKHLREEHGIDAPPAKRAEAASLHAKLHAPTTDAATSRDASVIAGVTRKPEPASEEPAKATEPKATRTRKPAAAKATEETPKPATRTRSRKATAPADADATATPPARRPRTLKAVPDAPEEPEATATRTRTRKPAADAEMAPKPATRSRKAPATETPAKPATRGTRTRREAPAPAPAASANGELSRSERKRALAREVVTLVTERFADLSEAEKADIAYWLHWCPTGNLWWPSNGFPEPTTDGWIRGKARLAEQAKANGK